MRSLPTIIGNWLPQSIPSPTPVGTSSWTAVSAGPSYTMAVNSSSQLFAWGNNSVYQLGDTTTITRSSPVQVATQTYNAPNNSWSQVSAGYDHATAIDRTGRLWTWGNFASIGLVVNNYSWTQVSGNIWHTLAIRSDNTLWTWGLGTLGQLGTGLAITYSSPIQIGSSSWSAVSAGASHSMAIRIDNTLWTWGSNVTGELGLGTTINQSSPVQVNLGYSATPASSSNAYVTQFTGSAYIQAGVNTNWTFLHNGTAWYTQFWIYQNSSSVQAVFSTNTFGLSGYYGQGFLINNTSYSGAGVGGVQANFVNGTTTFNTYNSAASLVMNQWNFVVFVFNGTTGAFYINGALSAGTNVTGNTFSGNAPTYTLTIGAGNSNNSSNFQAYSLSYITNLLIATGTAPATVATPVYTPFSNYLGVQLLTLQTNTTPVDASSNNYTMTWSGWPVLNPVTSNTVGPYNLYSISNISAGVSYSVALRSDKLLFTWGTNSVNQLGTGDTITRSSPIQIGTSSWTQVSAGYDHSVAIGSNNKLYMWGNQYGTNIALIPNSWTQIAESGNHTLAIRADGTLWGWGYNAYGQLGTGNNISYSSPIQVLSGGSWASVAVGDMHTLAIKTNGWLYTWGLNNYGQLGQANINNKAAPVLIGSSLPTDTSSNAYTISTYSTTMSDFSPFATPGTTGYSAYFDGTSSYLNAYTAAPQLSTATTPFTMEVWAYFTGFTGGVVLSSLYGGSGNIPFVLGMGTANGTPGATPWFGYYNGSAWATVVQSSTSLNLNTWYHMACVYTGSTATIYVNGTSVGSASYSTWLSGAPSTTGFLIGRRWDTSASPYHNGYLSNFRFVIGTAVYTATFTPPTGPLSATQSANVNGSPSAAIASGTTLLVIQSLGTPTSWAQVTAGQSYSLALNSSKVLYGWGYNGQYQLGIGSTGYKQIPVLVGTTTAPVDNSGNSYTVTLIGAPVVSAFGPFTGSTSYSSYFNGSTDYLYYTQSSNFAIGTSNFTIELWAYPTSAPGSNWTPLFSMGYPGGGQEIRISQNINGGGFGFLYPPNSGTTDIYYSYGTLPLFTWTHLALVRQGTNIIFFKNGAPVGAYANASFNFTSVYTPISAPYIGADKYPSDGYFNGYISNVRFVNGTAVYTGAFVRPTTPLTATQSAGTTNINAITSGTQVLILQNTSLATTNGSGSMSYSQVSAGYDHAGAVDFSGNLWSWGNPSSVIDYNFTIPQSWSQVSSGGNQTLAIRSDGTLWAWGYNAYGQLGNLSTTNQNSPVQIGLRSWNYVNTGLNHTVGIRNDGTLWTWGLNNYGQLGQNNTIYTSSPVQVSNVVATSNISTIQAGWNYATAGVDHTGGIDSSGLLYGWGNTTSLQLTGINYSWTQLALGASHTVGIRSDGTLWTWGYNGYGQLGNNSTTNYSSPIQIGSSSWSQISAGQYHTGGITTAGTLYMWGYNGIGQLGNNSITNYSSPVAVSITIVGQSWSQVAAGDSHTVAIDNNGYIWSWGINNNGQLGVGDVVNRSAPMIVSGNKPPLDYSGNNYPLTVAGTAASFSVNPQIPTLVASPFPVSQGYAYGNNNGYAFQFYAGYLTSPDNTNLRVGGNDFSVEGWVYLTSIPTSGTGYSIMGKGTVGSTLEFYFLVWNNGGTMALAHLYSLNGTTTVTVISTGTGMTTGTWYHVAMSRSGNQVQFWCNGTQLSVASGTPSASNYYGGAGLFGVGASGSGSYIVQGSLSNARFSNGGTQYWSGNFTPPTSPLGGGTLLTCQLPGVITSGWSKASSGSLFSVALQGSSLFTWGAGTLGQLGINSAISRSSPVQVSNANTGNWNTISAGTNHVLAIDSNNNLWAWGNNAVGQLGIGSTVQQNSPAQVLISGNSLSWSVAQAANTMSSAIQNGTLYTWGLNSSGQLGNGTTVNASSPVLATFVDEFTYGPQNWQNVWLGYGSQHIIALNNGNGTGALYGWGLGTTGQLGNNAAVSKSSPVQVNSIATYTSLPVQIGTGGLTFNTVYSGNSYSVALRGDGTLWTWGQNTVATGIVTAVSSPTQVGSVYTPYFVAGAFNNNVNQNPYGQGCFYYSASTPSLALGSSDWTMEAWVYLQPNRNNNQGGNHFPILSGTGWVLSAGIDGYQGVNLQIAGIAAGGGYTSVISGPGVNPGVWTHIAASKHVLSNGNVDYSVWTNGVINTANVSGNTTINTGAQTVFIGCNPASVYATTGANSYFTGKIAQVRIIIGGQAIYQCPYPGSNINNTQCFQPIFNTLTTTNVGRAGWGVLPSVTGTTVSLIFQGTNSLVDTAVIGTWTASGNATYPNANIPYMTLGAPFYRSFVQVSAGYDHAVGISSDGTLWTWGNANSIVISNTPRSWIALSVGQLHTLGIRSDNMLFTWGGNSVGQLGTGDAITRSSPTQLGGFSWISVSAGYSHSMALRSDNLLFVWGYNATGQLGQTTIYGGGDTINRSSPVSVGVSGAGALSYNIISAGTSASAAIDTSGNLWIWGSQGATATNGQLGDGTTINKSSPVQVTNINTNNWKQIALGFDHTIAIDNNNMLWGWGNTTGLVSTYAPYSWTMIRFGISHAVGLRSDQSIWTWGGNSAGQLGTGDAITRSSPTQILASAVSGAGGYSGAQAFIAAGDMHSFFGLNNNVMYAAGLNNVGQLGLGDTINRSVPTAVSYSWLPLGSQGFQTIGVAAGASFTVAIRSDNTLWSWGYNNVNQLGTGDTINRSNPTQIGLSGIGTVTSSNWWYMVEAGYDHAIAIDNNSYNIWTWGSPTYTGWLPTVPHSWSQISVGVSHVLAIDNNNYLWSWGLNSSGQLGIGNAIPRSSPVQIGASTWHNISAGLNHSLAIDSSNNLWAWGDNTYGELGTNNVVLYSSPVQISSSGNWNQLSAGANISYAVDSNNNGWAWGYNLSGYLGLGTTDVSNRSSPTQLGNTFGGSYMQWSTIVANPILVNQVSAGILNNGYAFTWGTNTYGTLGNGTTSNQKAPTLVGGYGSSIPIDQSGNNNTYALVQGGAGVMTYISPWGNGGGGGNGWAGVFNSANTAYLSITNTANLALTNQNFTIETWFYYYTIPVTYPMPIFYWQGTGAAVTSAVYLYINSNQYIGYQITQASGAALSSSAAAAILTINNWYHVAVNRNGNQFNVYLNGTSIAAYTWVANGSMYAGTSNFIGYNGVASNYYNGFMSNYRVTIGSSIYGSGNFTPSGPLGSTGNNGILLFQNWGNANNWNSLSLGDYHILAIRNDNTLWAWGYNNNYQLGNISTANQSSPIQVANPTNSTWNYISAGTQGSMGIDSNSILWVWGLGSSGQLLENNTNTYTSPVQVPNINGIGWSNGVNVIGLKGTWGYAVRSDGGLFVAGGVNGGNGTGTPVPRSSPTQIGNGIANVTVSTPTQIYTQQSWLYATAGQSWSAAINSSGKLYAWGINASYQLGTGDTFIRSSPTQIGIGLSFSMVKAAQSTGVALNSLNGLLYNWGSNAYGALGVPGITTSASPTLLGTTSWNFVAAGYSNMGAIRGNDNTMWLWGADANSQTGDGTTVTKSSPTMVGPLYVGAYSKYSPTQLGWQSNWTAVSAGQSFSMALNNVGQIYTWGFNGNGSLGDNTTITKSSPVQIGSTIGNGSWILISAGASSASAINTVYNLYTWGLDTTGQLGLSTTATYSYPQIVPGSWVSVSIQSHAGAISSLPTSPGNMFMWGNGANGQLGANNALTTSSPNVVGTPSIIANTSSPVQVGWLSNWTSVSAGQSFTLAINSSNQVYGWGLNNYGQLGSSNTIQYSSPTLVGYNVNYAPIINGYGQVSQPYLVGGTYSAVSAGYTHSTFLNSYLYSSGYGGNGETGLGYGAPTTVYSPVLVGNYVPSNTSQPTLINSSTSWTSVSAGTSYTMALKTSDSTLWAWGYNGYGELGDYSSINRSYAVQVGWLVVGRGGRATNNSWGGAGGIYIGDGGGVGGSGGTYSQQGSDPGGGAGGGAGGYAGTGGRGADGWNATTSVGYATAGSGGAGGGGAQGNTGDYNGNGAFSGSGGGGGGTSVWGQTSINGSTNGGAGSVSTASNSIGVSGASFVSVYGTFIGSFFTGMYVTGTNIGTGAVITSVTTINNGATYTLNLSVPNSNTVTGLITAGATNGGGAASGFGTGSVTGGKGGWPGGGGAAMTTNYYGGGSGAGAAGGDGAVNIIWGGTTPTFPSPVGAISNQVYTTPGSYTWVVPAGVTLISVVVIGGGAGGSGYNSGGAGGGGLGYKNNIPVVPGDTYTVTVGAGGAQVAYGVTGNNGGDSYFAHANAWSQYKAGNYTSLAISAINNTLWAWGLGSSGQLGFNNTNSLNLPTQLGTSSWTQITSGLSTSMGIHSDGGLWAWGTNASGQIGLNYITTLISQSSPVLINSSANYTAPTLSSQTSASWYQVSAGQSYSLAIRADGTLWTWGLNNYGQLGINSSLYVQNNIIQVGNSSWIQVVAGSVNSVGITIYNNLFGWGGYTYGAVGDGSTVNKSVPIQIATSTSFTSVNIGNYSATPYAITSNNLLYGWGQNNYGQIDYNLVSRSVPTTLGNSNINLNTVLPVQVTNQSWNQVQAGVSSTSALGRNADMYTWGINTVGQLGTGDTFNRSSPTQIGVLEWASVGAGQSNAYGIKTTGTLYGWGLNNSGQLAQVTIVSTSSPVQIGNTYLPFTNYPLQIGYGTSFGQVAAGNSFSMATSLTGVLYAWGVNNVSQLGTGDTYSRSSPVAIANAIPQYFKGMSAGYDHAVAVDNLGYIYGWGNNNVGQVLGTVQTVPQSWTQIASNDISSHAVAIRNDNTIWTWGYNGYGQLGTGDTINRSSPVLVGITNVNNSWVYISSGSNSTYAIRRDGSLWAWGLNSSGQLGNNGTTTYSSPVQIGTSSWTQVNGGPDHVIAINSLGLLYSWGNNNNGQLGTSDTINRSAPVLIGNIGTSSWTQIGAGASFSMAINTIGQLYAWGYNGQGQLGIVQPFTATSSGSTISFSAPTQVSSNMSWTQIAPGYQHTIALDAGTFLWSWGLNSSGQLGDGTTINRSSPVQIGSSAWGKVNGGFNNSIVLTANGIVFIWGSNASGQLGDGTTINRSIPVQIGALTWSNVIAGASNFYGTHLDGTLYAWGNQTSVGQLGLTSDVALRSSPTLVGYNNLIASVIPTPSIISNTNIWLSITAGQSTTMAITSTQLLYAWGLGTSGQLGQNNTNNSNLPVQIGVASWSLVNATNWGTSLAINTNGILFTWGNDSQGQFGTNYVISVSSPVQVGSNYYNQASVPSKLQTLYSWAQVSAGNSYTLAVRSDGKLFTWGYNVQGELGNNSVQSLSSPVQVGYSSWAIVNAGSGGSQAVAITT